MNVARAKAKRLALLIAFSFLFSSLVFAQTSPEPANPSPENTPANAAPEHGNKGEGDETAEFKHSASVQLLSRITGLSLEGAYWLAVVLNFAIVVALIAWASKKTLPTMFRNRTASIQKALEEARRASEDANRRLGEIESRLGRLGDEITQMRTTSEKEAAAEEERIKAAAIEDGKRIIESAEQEIAAATKSARRELTAFAADLAVNLAAKQIRVDTPADQALVRRFAQQISNGTSGKKA
ncbi:MAG TPA: ATP synthase F0 subunit B [Terriglobales bacterium]|nr:ATP synthase F0 subunit B [Terriglobales bacterium]